MSTRSKGTSGPRNHRRAMPLVLLTLLAGTSAIQAQSGNYLLLVADTATVTGALRTSLLNTGLLGNVDIHPHATTLPTPTLAQLMQYDAVLTYTNQSYADGAAMGDVLADYVDSGGGVVVAVYAVSTTTANRSLRGRWETGGYDIIPARSGNTTTATSLGTVHLPSHALWNGMTGFSGSTNYARSTTVDAAPHAVRVADWATGGVLAATSTVWPNRVDLNFYPSPWHTTTDGARLLANALIVAGTSASTEPGGCCFADGTCQILTGQSCISQSGTFRGPNTDCATACPQPGACCFVDGTCQAIFETQCASGGGVWQGANTNCASVSCPLPGACCVPWGCIVRSEGQCASIGGTYRGNGTLCETANCPPATVSNIIGFNWTTAASTTPNPQSWNRISAAEGVLSNVLDDQGQPTAVTIQYGGGPAAGFTYLGTGTLAPDAVPQYIYNLSGMTGYGFRSSAAPFTVQLSGLNPGREYEYWFVAYRATSAIENRVQVSLGDTLNAITYDQVLTATANNGRFIVNEIDANSTMDWNELSRVTTSSSTGTITFNWAGIGTQTTVIGALAIREVLGSSCYANCDGSTVEPVLNVDDFTCFINEFAQAQTLPHEQQVAHYANCDGSTIAPALNVDDFTCFINRYAQGCP
jgi:hypothetical protein